MFLVFSSLPFGPKLAQDFRNCFRHTQTLPKSNGIDMTSYALHVEKMFQLFSQSCMTWVVAPKMTHATAFSQVTEAPRY